VAFPARFSLIAAMNPCPCCNLGHPLNQCTCSESEIVRYRSRLSGALADRIDMHVTLPPVAPELLDNAHSGESSITIRARVERSREIQRQRFNRLAGVTCNAHASGRWLLSRGDIKRDARSLLTGAMHSLSLSARAYHRMLRVARTIADIEQSRTVQDHHVAEALRYRPRWNSANTPLCRNNNIAAPSCAWRPPSR